MVNLAGLTAVLQLGGLFAFFALLAVILAGLFWLQPRDAAPAASQASLKRHLKGALAATLMAALGFGLLFSLDGDWLSWDRQRALIDWLDNWAFLWALPCLAAWWAAALAGKSQQKA